VPEVTEDQGVLIDSITGWLKRSGWAVPEHHTRPASQSYAIDHLLTLESTHPPRGVKVEVDIRISDNTGYEWWDREQLLSVTVRYAPRQHIAGPVPETYLTGDEVRPQSYRQLTRVLTWFRDPLAWEANRWDDRPEPGDWMPPAAWDANLWGEQFGMEHRWPTSAEPLDMLRCLPGQPEERKLQLVACACFRLLQLEMLHFRNRLAVETAEQYAEGAIRRREMKKICKHSDLPWLAHLGPSPLAQLAVEFLMRDRPTEGAFLAADIIRDVLGDPFHPVALRHSWLRREGRAVRHLADAIAVEGRYNELPILADALEDAGCTERALLEHCRGPGPHIRGCWALDLLRPPERTP
jgi:hypothetical protein